MRALFPNLLVLAVAAPLLLANCMETTNKSSRRQWALQDPTSERQSRRRFQETRHKRMGLSLPGSHRWLRCARVPR